MSLLRQSDTDPDFPTVSLFREQFGFVPAAVQAQKALPRLIDAEFAISNELLFTDHVLTRAQKELIGLAIAIARENSYEIALSSHVLHSLGFNNRQLDQFILDYRDAGLSQIDVALLDFALRLGSTPCRFPGTEMARLRALGAEDKAILELVNVTSWATYRSVLSTGLGARPDVQPPQIPPARLRRTNFPPPDPGSQTEHQRGIASPALPDSFPPFASFKKNDGFVPSVYRAQTLRPDLIEAEVEAARLVLEPNDFLSHRQKEAVFLAVSASNLSAYCVAFHCEMLRRLDISLEESERIALDHHNADLSLADRTLLDVCLRLTREPVQFGQADLQRLREHGFCAPRITEAIAVVALAHFFNILGTGLGADPDFVHQIPLDKNAAHPFPPSRHPTLKKIEPQRESTEADPDAECVARVQSGDTAAFEELVRRHGRRVSRTLAGILRQTEDVEDATQDAFVRAFQHIGEFAGRSKFSTWLTRIAVNTGLQRLRQRKDLESLDEVPDAERDFRPRQVQAWEDDPEQLYSAQEARDFVHRALMQLPLKYRVVVILRDLQQFSTAEAAAALDLGIPALKARLFRGRLMLREALTPCFSRSESKKAHDKLQRIPG